MLVSCTLKNKDKIKITSLLVENQEKNTYFSTNAIVALPHTTITSKFKMRWFLMPDEENNFGASLALDLRIS